MELISNLTQPSITSPKLKIVALEQGMNTFKFNKQDTRTKLVSLLLTLNIFHTLFYSVSIVNFEQVSTGLVATCY